MAVESPARPAPLRGVNGQWSCDECGTVAPWGPGWAWFGNYRVVGYGSNASEKPNIERVVCPGCPRPKMEAR
jgi:hypothetical protein